MRIEITEEEYGILRKARINRSNFLFLEDLNRLDTIAQKYAKAKLDVRTFSEQIEDVKQQIDDIGLDSHIKLDREPSFIETTHDGTSTVWVSAWIRSNAILG